MKESTDCSNLCSYCVHEHNHGYVNDIYRRLRIKVKH